MIHGCKEKTGFEKLVFILDISAAFYLFFLTFIRVGYLLSELPAIPLSRWIMSCYLVIFGIFILCAEFSIKTVTEYFSFLESRFGLGFFFFFLAMLYQDVTRWYNEVGSIILAVACVINFFMSCTGKDEKASTNA